MMLGDIEIITSSPPLCPVVSGKPGDRFTEESIKEFEIAQATFFLEGFKRTIGNMQK